MGNLMIQVGFSGPAGVSLTLAANQGPQDFQNAAHLVGTVSADPLGGPMGRKYCVLIYLCPPDRQKPINWSCPSSHLSLSKARMTRAVRRAAMDMPLKNSCAVWDTLEADDWRQLQAGDTPLIPNCLSRRAENAALANRTRVMHEESRTHWVARFDVQVGRPLLGRQPPRPGRHQGREPTGELPKCGCDIPSVTLPGDPQQEDSSNHCDVRTPALAWSLLMSCDGAGPAGPHGGAPVDAGHPGSAAQNGDSPIHWAEKKRSRGGGRKSWSVRGPPFSLTKRAVHVEWVNPSWDGGFQSIETLGVVRRENETKQKFWTNCTTRGGQ